MISEQDQLIAYARAILDTCDDMASELPPTLYSSSTEQIIVATWIKTTKNRTRELIRFIQGVDSNDD